MTETDITPTETAPDSEFTLLADGEHIRINEIHSVVINSPILRLESVQFNAGNIVGAVINGQPASLGMIQGVNVTIDGVNFECDLEWLLLLTDLAFRDAIIAKIKAEHAAEMAKQSADLEAQKAADKKATVDLQETEALATEGPKPRVTRDAP